MLSKSNSLLCADYLELESLYRKSFLYHVSLLWFTCRR